MSFGTKYLDLYDYIVTLLKNLTDAKGNIVFVDVYKTVHERPGKTPIAYVLPRPSRIEPASTDRTHYVCVFDIVICVLKSGDEGLRDVLNILGLVNDELIKDRTQGGRVLNTEARTFDVVREEREMMRSWSALRVEFLIRAE